MLPLQYSSYAFLLGPGNGGRDDGEENTIFTGTALPKNILNPACIRLRIYRYGPAAQEIFSHQYNCAPG
jgi:hypothetical protein